MPNRNDQIDILRGIGIIAMILIHVTAWHKVDVLAFHLWNASQFAVQVFIFCSGFLFFVKELTRNTKLSLSYFGKRALRLLVPYYVFLLFYLPLEFIEAPKRLTSSYILKTLTLTGGTDLNWIILLFLCLAVLMPLLLFLLRKHRVYFYIYIFIATLFSIAIFKFQISNFKLMMWLPWSLIVLFSWFFAKVHNRIASLYIFLSGFVTTVLLSFYLSVEGRSLVFFDNKYPPNLYFLLYGIVWISGTWFLLSFVDLRKKEWSIIRFFSVHSYSIYFIHFWIFTFMRVVLKVDLHWGYLFAIVMLASVLTQKLVSSISSRFHVV